VRTAPLSYETALTHPPQEGDTALHWAAAGGHAEIVRMLLQHKAPALVHNGVGASPLHLAAVGGHVEAAAVLLHDAQVPPNVLDRARALRAAMRSCTVHNATSEREC
jgi:hypothetical protein